MCLIVTWISHAYYSISTSNTSLENNKQNFFKKICLCVQGSKSVTAYMS